MTEKGKIIKDLRCKLLENLSIDDLYELILMVIEEITVMKRERDSLYKESDCFKNVSEIGQYNTTIERSYERLETYVLFFLNQYNNLRELNKKDKCSDGSGNEI